MFSREMLKSVLERTPIGYARLDIIYDELDKPQDFLVVETNSSFKQITGLDKEVIGRRLEGMDNNNEFIDEISYILKGILNNTNTTTSKCFESIDKCLDIYGFSMDEDSVIIQIIDRTKEIHLERELIKRAKEFETLSYYDKLTGLYNRAFFEEEIKRLDTSRNLPISIIMGDTNGLKLINDIFGHAAGDQLIKATADILTKSCRQEDIVARWGGDEFIILLPKTSSAISLEIINRIKGKFSTETFDMDYLNISLGYSIKTDRSKPISEVIIEAENDMYKNKSMEGQEIRNLIVRSMMNYLYEGNIEVKYHMGLLKKHTSKLGESLKLSQSEIDKLNIICEVHDIGNVSIDKSILFKSENLTDKDWEEIKRHPEISYRIAKAIPELTNVANYILHHHERWDGKGYPHQLKGEEIPLLSRIFSIVDAFDAMTQDKSYRKAYSNEYAIQYLRDNAGTEFDPYIVDVFTDNIYIQ